MRTTKQAAMEVDDWIMLFDAVIKLCPPEIKAIDTITETFVIRDYAKGVSKKLWNEEMESVKEIYCHTMNCLVRG